MDIDTRVVIPPEARCLARSRRQHVMHVMPEPQPISCGSHSHGMPVFSTTTTP